MKRTDDGKLSQQPSDEIIWERALDESLSQQILAVVFRVAEKLCDVPVVVEQARLISGSLWQETSLTAGYPSIALFFLTLFKHTHDEYWQVMARTYMRLAARATHLHPFGGPTLSKGICGLATVFSEDDIFAEERSRLDRHLCQQVLQYPWMQYVDGQWVLNYDIITGVAGILGYLLKKAAHTPLKEQAIEYLVTALIHFAIQTEGADGMHEIDRIGGIDGQRWALPVSGKAYGREINCGLAHGIPGPLAALSLAYLAGYAYPGQREAIQRMASWLLDQALFMPWGIDWPDRLPLLSEGQVGKSAVQPARSAWCYGAPGILRALSFAGEALSDERIKATVVQGVQALVARPAETRTIDPLTLCHGNAGLLLILLHFWHELKLPQIRNQITQLATTIVQQFNPALPLGFHYHFQHQNINSPGLLYGVSGTVLALLAAASHRAPDWDRLLLVS